MWAAVLAWVLAVSCIVAAILRGRRLSGLQDAREIRDRMGHASLERLELLREQLGGPARELLDGVLDAGSQRQVIAEINAVVGDLKYELVGAHDVAKSASRIALAGSALLAVLELIRFLRGTGSVALLLTCVAAGLVGGLVCTALARSAQTRARGQLDAWNHITRRLTEVSEARFQGSGVRD
ncbi:MAG: hypothetical protein KC766_19375 [Myxococcales bacterium]|nr:hypothetical protein [Myxococcales bacterium]